MSTENQSAEDRKPEDAEQGASGAQGAQPEAQAAQPSHPSSDQVDGLKDKKPEELTPDELRLMADTMPGEGPGD